jgi:hypothetical protein
VESDIQDSLRAATRSHGYKSASVRLGSPLTSPGRPGAPAQARQRSEWLWLSSLRPRCRCRTTGTCVTCSSLKSIAAASPGVGALVALPSVPGHMGKPKGEGFDVPATTPALRPVAQPAPTPSYADPAVSGLGFGRAAGCADPTRARTDTAANQHHPTHPVYPRCRRNRAAWDALLGRH